jgi:transcription initiation factor TFIIB
VVLLARGREDLEEEGVECVDEECSEHVYIDDQYIYDEGFPRGHLPEGEALSITFTRHDLGVGAEISAERGRNPLTRPAAGPKHSGVTRKDVPLVTALRILDDACKALGVPKTAKETAGILISAYYKSVKRAPSRHEPLVAAALLKAAEIHDIPLAQGEVLEFLGVTLDELWRARTKISSVDVAKKLYIKSLKSKRARGNNRFVERASVFIQRITAQLGLPPEVALLARRIVEESLKAERKPGQRKDLNGKRPEAIAAASVYLSARLLGYDNVTQKSVASAVKLKDNNVRKHYRFLIDNVAIVVYV